MKIYILILPLMLCGMKLAAQGCVAIRSNGAACTMPASHDQAMQSSGHWLLGINNRFFRSYKHFVGDEEQKHRVDEHTEVINHFFSTEVGLTRVLNSRLSFGLYVPVTSNTRSSKYEHYGNNSSSPNARRETHSFGLGDVRLAAYYWLLDPAKAYRGNLQLGLGLKLPTGDYRYMDYFQKNDSTKILGPVDQSIQLGDGGTGISVEGNGYWQTTKTTNLYVNAYYLLNPREQNGVSTTRGGAPSSMAVAYGSDVMSVPDQFMARAGINYTQQRFTFSAGARIEGVPAKDLVGGSNGFRRPGYVVSLEPVVAYKMKSSQLYLSVPYAVERNRTQSVPDKLRTQKTGVYSQGDAAFADYTVNFGISVLL